MLLRMKGWRICVETPFSLENNTPEIVVVVVVVVVVDVVVAAVEST